MVKLINLELTKAELDGIILSLGRNNTYGCYQPLINKLRATLVTKITEKGN